MKKVIVIVGATASGKSDLALKLANELKTEIISADAFQIYKEINVGINKPNNNELELIKHHFVNSHSIYQDFDIKIFQDECIPILNKLFDENKIPIICGGSNLYIDAVIKGYKLDKSESREQISYFDNWTYDEIYNYVLEKDYDEAIKINYQNTKRIIRAAQIIHETKQKKSEIDNQIDNYEYDVLIIETLIDREILHKAINSRVDKMIDNNWKEEIINLLSKDSNIINLKAFQAIGYKQIANSIKNNLEIDIEVIKQLTRQFAKRQMTWNRNKYKEIIRFDPINEDYSDILNTVNNFINLK
ncbi:MAG: tRNA (adenosine(37)-N6)-dimethylallyltransferase MiaA [Mycoplasma sp.]